MTITDNMIDTSSLLRCYALLTLGFVLSFVPIGILSGLAFMALVIGIIWAYRLRKNPDPLFVNHTQWMIRSFWISSLLFFVAMLASGAIVSANADQSAIAQLPEILKSGSATPQDIEAMMNQYHEANKDLLLWSTLGCFMPPVAYSCARFVKGYCLADAGKPVANVRNWLV